MLLLGRKVWIAQRLFYRTPLQQECCLPYRHMPEIADTTAAQAYRTEEEGTYTYEAQPPSCSTHASYAIPGFLRATLARHEQRAALGEQRDRTAPGKTGFVTVKMLDVVFTQLPAVVIAISRIKIGKP